MDVVKWYGECFIYLFIPSKQFLEHHSNMCNMKAMECDRGCGALIIKMKMKEHECDFEKCPFSEYGCKFRSKSSEMEKHIQEMVAVHLSFTVKVVTWYINISFGRCCRPNRSFSRNWLCILPLEKANRICEFIYCRISHYSSRYWCSFIWRSYPSLSRNLRWKSDALQICTY